VRPFSQKKDWLSFTANSGGLNVKGFGLKRFKFIKMKVYQNKMIAAACAVLFALPFAAFAQMPKVHRHYGKMASTLAEVAPEFSMAETTLKKADKKANVAINKNRTFEAFTVDDEIRIFIKDRKTGKIFEIKGLPFEWRYFSDLVWADNQTLMFDRWSEPHFAVHYAVNAVKRKLIAAKPFPDAFMLGVQKRIRNQKKRKGL
jgi:hypothetical protein